MSIYYRTFFLIFLLNALFLVGCSNLQLQPTNTINASEPCWQQTLKYEGTRQSDIKQALDKKIVAYQSLVERSLSERAQIIKVAQQLKDRINQDKPLSGYDLDLLNRGMLVYLKRREKLYEIAEAYECWLGLSKQTIKRFNIDAKNHLKGIMLSLSAALILYDNYMLAISIFEQDEKLRRFLNERDSGYGIRENELARITQSYNSVTKRKRLQKALNFYDEQMPKLSNALENDKPFNYLKMLIAQSPSYKMTQSDSAFSVIERKLKFMAALTSDALHQLTADGVNLFSQVFGNSIGLIETRKGKLYDRPEVLDFVKGKLKAGDILLEKTPFRLTDQFIPGHWGHAAIWIGTEAELKELGIWEEPLVKQYHTQIKKGHHVVEALRSGVQISALSHFLNIDDLAILRNSKLDNRTVLADRILLALRQVGKEYDFNFDVETTDKIVCSELIYVVYTSISWPTDKTLGRFTISPDNVASKALEGGPLKLIMFFHDGKFVGYQPLELMEQLMKGNEE
jgi:uncharacterized protein YycO